MSALFLKVLNLSISAGWLILAVVVLRLVLRRAPGWSRCVLWALVGLRLAVPVSLESALSLIPSAETVPVSILEENTFRITSGLAAIDRPVNDYLGSRYYEGVTVPTGTGAGGMEILGWIWLAGAAAVLVWGLVSYLLLRRRLAEAVPTGEGVWVCDAVDTPFLLGVLRPRIYLPSDLDSAAAAYVVAHERAHLARRDHWWKPLGFLLLAVYWFHPLVWLAYALFCRDMELACDQRVARGLEPRERKAYSMALLACSVPRHMLSACPLAFGEIGVKERIQAVLRYRKPAVWVVCGCAVVCAVVALCFLTNPRGSTPITWLQGLSAEDVAEMDLVVMSRDPQQNQDRMYQKLSAGEIDDAVAFLRRGSGRSTEKETVGGQRIWFYLTMADGTKHQVGNLGDRCLVVDGMYYAADPAWLESWWTDYGSGDSPLPEGFFGLEVPMDTVRALAAKGEDLTWSDMEGYPHTDVGSGLIIWAWEVEGGYRLYMGGPSLEELPWYVTLETGEEGIDLRTDDLEAFLRKMEKETPSVERLLEQLQSTPAQSSRPGDYIDANPEVYQQLLDRGDETLCYLFDRFLKGGETGLRGHLMRCLLDDLAPEAQLKLAADTGQAYFDAWLEAARQVEREWGMEWMEENAHAQWLLLTRLPD